MRRTFSLVHSKIKTDRLVEGVRADVNKYLKRERKKALPEGMDYWDFDVKNGATEAEAQVIHVSEIGKYIGQAAEQKLESLFLEIHAHAKEREGRHEDDTMLDKTVVGIK